MGAARRDLVTMTGRRDSIGYPIALNPRVYARTATTKSLPEVLLWYCKGFFATRCRGPYRDYFVGTCIRPWLLHISGLKGLGLANKPLCSKTRP